MRVLSGRRDDGASLVEAAFILPLVILLLMGVVDFARGFLAEITLNNAVSEGALYAAQFPDNLGNTKQRVREAGDDLDLEDADITVTCIDVPDPDPDQIEVAATADVDMLTPVGQWFGSVITLDSESTAINTQSDPCAGDVFLP